ncbi:hypothetical protein BTVI_31055 [Pitangus sulphuratus]|nr:hypothetical protein BTVI_31055 [Pitangus sulphuratus]
MQRRIINETGPKTNMAVSDHARGLALPVSWDTLGHIPPRSLDQQLKTVIARDGQTLQALLGLRWEQNDSCKSDTSDSSEIISQSCETIPVKHCRGFSTEVVESLDMLTTPNGKVPEQPAPARPAFNKRLEQMPSTFPPNNIILTANKGMKNPSARVQDQG